MSLGDQFRRIATKAAQFRQAIFGTDSSGTVVQIEYNGGEFTHDGYYSPFKSEARTEEAGYMEVYDGVVRFSKDVGYVPERKKRLIVNEAAGNETRRIELVIETIWGFHATSVEWVLGCKAMN